MKQLDKQSSYEANVYTVTPRREPFPLQKPEFGRSSKNYARGMSTGYWKKRLATADSVEFAPSQGLRKSRRAKKAVTPTAMPESQRAMFER